MERATQKTVGITGSGGLIGWHLRCRIFVENDLDVVVAEKQCFEQEALIDAFIRKCDGIVHLAGQNRGPESEVESTNIELARWLIDGLLRTGRTPHIIFSSSTHIDRDTAYGRSKRIASENFRAWAESAGAICSCFVLPHVFGEHGRPFSNSVVSTFCYQLVHGERPVIDHDSSLELLHVQDVAEQIIECIHCPVNTDVRPPGERMVVSEMLEILDEMNEKYSRGVIPALGNPIRLSLFNTFRSYLFPSKYPVSLTLHDDNRGILFEAVKTHHGGQAFMSSTKLGVTRGNHFHFNKVERFLVLDGQARIRVRRLFHNEESEFIVNGAKPVYVDMPTLHTHNITNIGSTDLKTFFWSHEIYDPDKSDTFGLEVERGEDIR